MAALSGETKVLAAVISRRPECTEDMYHRTAALEVMHRRDLYGLPLGGPYGHRDEERQDRGGDAAGVGGVA